MRAPGFSLLLHDLDQARGDLFACEQRLDELLAEQLHKAEGIGAGNGEFTRLARDRGLKSHERRKTMTELFKNTAGIEFEVDPWYNDPKVEEFLKDPLAMLGK